MTATGLDCGPDYIREREIFGVPFRSNTEVARALLLAIQTTADYELWSSLRHACASMHSIEMVSKERFRLCRELAQAEGQLTACACRIINAWSLEAPKP